MWFQWLRSGPRRERIKALPRAPCRMPRATRAADRGGSCFSPAPVPNPLKNGIVAQLCVDLYCIRPRRVGANLASRRRRISIRSGDDWTRAERNGEWRRVTGVTAVVDGILAGMRIPSDPGYIDSGNIDSGNTADLFEQPRPPAETPPAVPPVSPPRPNPAPGPETQPPLPEPMPDPAPPPLTEPIPA